jgi:hypothetical protein
MMPPATCDITKIFELLLPALMQVLAARQCCSAAAALASAMPVSCRAAWRWSLSHSCSCSCTVTVYMAGMRHPGCWCTLPVGNGWHSQSHRLSLSYNYDSMPYNVESKASSVHSLRTHLAQPPNHGGSWHLQQQQQCMPSSQLLLLHGSRWPSHPHSKTACVLRQCCCHLKHSAATIKSNMSHTRHHSMPWCGGDSCYARLALAASQYMYKQHYPLTCRQEIVTSLSIKVN